jgi:hypothetical protein
LRRTSLLVTQIDWVSSHTGARHEDGQYAQELLVACLKLYEKGATLSVSDGWRCHKPEEILMATPGEFLPN